MTLTLAISSHTQTPQTTAYSFTYPARDHLANERTYLAWMRTSLALIGASLALLKWDGTRDATGYIVAVVALVMMASSTDRYFTNMRHLERGEFRPNTRGIIFIVLVVLCAIASAFIVHFRDRFEGDRAGPGRGGRAEGS